MSARSTVSSSSKRASGSSSTRASRVIGAGQGLSAALGGFKDQLLKPGKRRGMLAGAVFAAYMTLLFASMAFWWALSNVMDQGWAALIVTAVWALVGALLYAASKGSSATRPS